MQAEPVGNSGALQIKTQVRIDPAQLQLARTGDHWTDTVDVKWVQVDADGNVLASTSQTLNLNIPQASYEDALRKGITFSGNVKLTDHAAEVRIVARDSGNGSVGTVDIPLTKIFPPNGAATPAKK